MYYILYQVTSLERKVAKLQQELQTQEAAEQEFHTQRNAMQRELTEATHTASGLEAIVKDLEHSLSVLGVEKDAEEEKFRLNIADMLQYQDRLKQRLAERYDKIFNLLLCYFLLCTIRYSIKRSYVFLSYFLLFTIRYSTESSTVCLFYVLQHA